MDFRGTVTNFARVTHSASAALRDSNDCVLLNMQTLSLIAIADAGTVLM
jgi:hypothetical protein